MTAVPNIHMAITKHCKSKKPAVAYSISLEYWVYDNFIKDGWSKPYSDE